MQWCDAPEAAAWRPPASVAESAESPSCFGAGLLPFIPSERDLNVLLDAVESVGAFPLDGSTLHTLPPTTPKQYSAMPVAPSFQVQSMSWNSSQIAAASDYSSTSIFKDPCEWNQDTRKSTCEVPAPPKARRIPQCQVPDCSKTARVKGWCGQHGGGKCCLVDGCKRAVHAHGNLKTHRDGTHCSVHGSGKTTREWGLCRRDGRGKLCEFPGCIKAAQWVGRCSVHIGARVCSAIGCAQPALERSSLCVTHCKMEPAVFQ